MKGVVKLGLLIVIFFLATVVQAKDEQTSALPDVRIPPESFYYPIIRIIEKAQVNFYLNSDSKADFYKNLVQKRVAELKHVVDNSYLDQIERSSQRVSYQVGILTDYIVSKNLNSKKSSIIDLYKKDKIILEKLRDKYPANSSFWMLIQHIINSIDINLQKL